MQQYCYFHKNHIIQSFCALKQCTLPLCEQCLDIHQNQHKQRSQKPKIIPYKQAYEQVLKNLSASVSNSKMPLQSLIQQIKQDKQLTIQAINDYFRQYEQKIKEQEKFLNEIQQKLDKLNKGSIKTVIYYFSGDISFKPIDLPEFNSIFKQIKKAINNIKNVKHEQIQTFRQQKAYENQWTQCITQSFEKKSANQSKKNLLLQNHIRITPQQKHTNEPYIESNPKKDETPIKKYYNELKYHNQQKQNSNLHQDQKSQVKNYFQNFQNQIIKNQIHFNQNINNVKIEPHQHPSNTDFYGIQLKNVRNLQIESYLGINSSGNKRIPLNQLPSATNLQKKQIRSKYIEKISSVNNLIHQQNNRNKSFNYQQNHKKIEKYNMQPNPSKWNKNKLQYNQIQNYHIKPHNQFTKSTEKNHENASANVQFTNRRPLKTTDLQTFTPSMINVSNFEGRQRAASHEIGLRTTMSHNNLPNKKQTLQCQDLKKGVLSPHQIRKMLEKKIEERNKVLTQKKQHQLKLHTEKVSSNFSNGYEKAHENMNGLRKACYIGHNNDIKNNSKGTPRQTQVNRAGRQNIKTVRCQDQEPLSLYNTKDSIINQIYRQTRY